MTPGPSTIQIMLDDVDITHRVLFAESTFEMQAFASPGQFRVVCKDPYRVFEPHTTQEISLIIDGDKLYGGLVTNVARRYFFPAVDTRDLSKVTARQWVLTGLDHNLWFDHLVTRNPTNYLDAIPMPQKNTGRVVMDYWNHWIDKPAGMDVTTHVDDTDHVMHKGIYLRQGSYAREQMDTLAQYGSIYYIDASKHLHFTNVERIQSPWGFTDADPDGQTHIGFREGSFSADMLGMVTDALVWGGSAIHKPGTDPGTGPAIGTVFQRYPRDVAADWSPTEYGPLLTREREQRAIDNREQYGRWQRAEFRPGEDQFMTDDACFRRAYSIVAGATGSDLENMESGFDKPLESASVSWFAHDVPKNEAGHRQHLKAGYMQTFQFHVLSTSSSPLIRVLPVRTIRISFPTLPPDPGSGPERLTYVRFDGEFGTSYQDPRFYWAFLRRARRQANTQYPSDTPLAAAPFRGVVTEAVDGSRVLFSIATAYHAGTTEVYLNGLLQRRGYEYTESQPGSGQITFVTPPAVDDQLWIVCDTDVP
jgi:hypothetical protein